MNLIDKAILEWSYKTKKGYPDINSQEDMALFESMFGFIPLIKENKDLVDLIKSNITGFGDITGTGSTNIRLQFSEVPARGASSTSLRGEIFKELEKLSKEENEITDYKKVKTRSSVGSAELTFKGKEYKIVIKGAASEDSADTDVKEGLVSLFYVSDITSPFTTENILKRAENLKSIANAGIPGEDSNSSQKVLKYLSALEPKNVHVKFINQPLSSALSIKNAYPEGNIIRSGEFNEIRSKARALTGMDSDKWCPGDLYVKLGTLPDISSIDNIEILNELFTQEWGASNKPLVAISLKQQKAQGGKAKGLLAKYSKVKTDYNLSNDEKEYDEDKYKKGIERLRKKVSGLIGPAENVVYKLDNQNLDNFNLDKLRGKYAALKAIEFLFRNFPSNKVDDAVVALAGFAMSLTSVNPGFFKLIGQSSGQSAKIESFPRGTNIVLYNNDGEYNDINIVDSEGYGGLRILFNVLKQGKPYSVQISARNNGNIQGTLEVEKIDPIG